MAKMLKLHPVNNRPGKPADAYALPSGTYWVRGVDGASLRLTVSEGPAGVGITLAKPVGAPRLTLTERLDFRQGEPQDGTWDEIGAVQYRTDERSQAFRAWVLGTEGEADIALLGESYRRKAKPEGDGVVMRAREPLS